MSKKPKEKIIKVKAWAVIGIIGKPVEFAEGELAIFFDRDLGFDFVNKTTDEQGNKIWGLVPCEIILKTSN